MCFHLKIYITTKITDKIQRMDLRQNSFLYNRCARMKHPGKRESTTRQNRSRAKTLSTLQEQH